MRVDIFDYKLPPERIALRPVSPRDAARLLVVRHQAPFLERHVKDLPDLLKAGDVLVLNDTKVIPAQLAGVRLPRTIDGHAIKISATLHQQVKVDTWIAFLKPAKRIQIGDQLEFQNNGFALAATVEARGKDGEAQLQFNCPGEALAEALMQVGDVPLPPYIASKRDVDEKDLKDYQTIYARREGAVAAPTAGLHVTPSLLDALQVKGIKLCYVTLHVGAGTFLPVKADDTEAHYMHSEYGELSDTTAALLNKTHEEGGRIVAMGTTSLRLLESATNPDGRLRAFAGMTNIFITPGYKFKAVDALVTNFHLPCSTLLMLVSAFCGVDTIKKAYEYAIDRQYRFYSYGDASLLFRS